MIQLLLSFLSCNILPPGRWREKVRGERTIKLYKNKNEMTDNWPVRIDRKKI